MDPTVLVHLQTCAFVHVESVPPTAPTPKRNAVAPFAGAASPFTTTRLTAALHTANATLQQLRALRPRPEPADSLAAGLSRIARQLAGVYDQVAGADVAPRPVVLTAVADLERTLAALQRRWRTLQRAP